MFVSAEALLARVDFFGLRRKGATLASETRGGPGDDVSLNEPFAVPVTVNP
jgi:hypothetical protein